MESKNFEQIPIEGRKADIAKRIYSFLREHPLGCESATNIAVALGIKKEEVIEIAKYSQEPYFSVIKPAKMYQSLYGPVYTEDYYIALPESPCFSATAGSIKEILATENEILKALNKLPEAIKKIEDVEIDTSILVDNIVKIRKKIDEIYNILKDRNE